MVSAVFSFQVDIVGGEMKREFSTETDVSWEDFRNWVIGYLAPTSSFELVYKVSDDNGKASHLDSVGDFNTAMERLCHGAGNACTRAVSLEIRNIVSALKYYKHAKLTIILQAKQPVAARKLNKRSREDDIPPELSGEMDSQLKAFNQFEQTIRCETHRGHCFIERTNGLDSHRHLDHSEMTLWAKKIVSLRSYCAMGGKLMVVLSRPWAKQPYITHLIVSTLIVGPRKKLAALHLHPRCPKSMLLSKT
jgi:hypothetical protein